MARWRRLDGAHTTVRAHEDDPDALAVLEAFRTVLRGPQWAAFGYPAAEAEVTRHRPR